MSAYRLQPNKRWIFHLLMALLLSMVFVRYVFSVDFPAAVLLAIAVAMVCVGDRDGILAVCLMCMPLTGAFQYTYALLAAAVALAVKYPKDTRIGLSLVPLVLLVVWELLHGLGGEFSPKRLVVMFIPDLLVCLLMWQRGKDADYGYIVRCLAVCTCAVCLTLIGSVLARSGYRLSAAVENMQRLGFTGEEAGSEELVMNPNSVGILCVLAVSGLLQLITTGRAKAWDLPMVVLMLVCGALTMSRTYLALVLIMTVLFWAAQEGSFLKKLRFLGAVILVGAVAAGILFAVFPAVMERFIERFSGSDLTSGRSDLFRDYSEFFFESPEVILFGVGLTDFSTRIMSRYQVSFNVPHNGIQEALIAWGIPGFGVFLILVGMMLLLGREKTGKMRLVNHIPLLLLLAKVQVGQMLTSDYTMLALVFACLSLCADLRPVRSLQ